METTSTPLVPDTVDRVVSCDSEMSDVTLDPRSRLTLDSSDASDNEVMVCFGERVRIRVLAVAFFRFSWHLLRDKDAWERGFQLAGIAVLCLLVCLIDDNKQHSMRPSLWIPRPIKLLTVYSFFWVNMSTVIGALLQELYPFYGVSTDTVVLHPRTASPSSVWHAMPAGPTCPLVKPHWKNASKPTLDWTNVGQMDPATSSQGEELWLVLDRSNWSTEEQSTPSTSPTSSVRPVPPDHPVESAQLESAVSDTPSVSQEETLSTEEETGEPDTDELLVEADEESDIEAGSTAAEFAEMTVEGESEVAAQQDDVEESDVPPVAGFDTGTLEEPHTHELNIMDVQQETFSKEPLPRETVAEETVQNMWVPPMEQQATGHEPSAISTDADGVPNANVDTTGAASLYEERLSGDGPVCDKEVEVEPEGHTEENTDSLPHDVFVEGSTSMSRQEEKVEVQPREYIAMEEEADIIADADGASLSQDEDPLPPVPKEGYVSTEDSVEASVAPVHHETPTRDANASPLVDVEEEAEISREESVAEQETKFVTDTAKGPLSKDQHESPLVSEEEITLSEQGSVATETEVGSEQNVGAEADSAVSPLQRPPEAQQEAVSAQKYVVAQPEADTAGSSLQLLSGDVFGSPPVAEEQEAEFSSEGPSAIEHEPGSVQRDVVEKEGTSETPLQSPSGDKTVESTEDEEVLPLVSGETEVSSKETVVREQEADGTQNDIAAEEDATLQSLLDDEHASDSVLEEETMSPPLDSMAADRELGAVRHDSFAEKDAAESSPPSLQRDESPPEEETTLSTTDSAASQEEANAIQNNFATEDDTPVQSLPESEHVSHSVLEEETLSSPKDLIVTMEEANAVQNDLVTGEDTPLQSLSQDQHASHSVLEEDSMTTEEEATTVQNDFAAEEDTPVQSLLEDEQTSHSVLEVDSMATEEEATTVQNNFATEDDTPVQNLLEDEHASHSVLEEETLSSPKDLVATMEEANAVQNDLVTGEDTPLQSLSQDQHASHSVLEVDSMATEEEATTVQNDFATDEDTPVQSLSEDEQTSHSVLEVDSMATEEEATTVQNDFATEDDTPVQSLSEDEHVSRSVLEEEAMSSPEDSVVAEEETSAVENGGATEEETLVQSLAEDKQASHSVLVEETTLSVGDCVETEQDASSDQIDLVAEEDRMGTSAAGLSEDEPVSRFVAEEEITIPSEESLVTKREASPVHKDFVPEADLADTTSQSFSIDENDSRLDPQKETMVSLEVPVAIEQEDGSIHEDSAKNDARVETNTPLASARDDSLPVDVHPPDSASEEELEAPLGQAAEFAQNVRLAPTGDAMLMESIPYSAALDAETKQEAVPRRIGSSESDERRKPLQEIVGEGAVTIGQKALAPQDGISLPDPFASEGQADVPISPARYSMTEQEVEASEKDASLLVSSAPKDAARLDLHQEEAVTAGREKSAPQDGALLTAPLAPGVGVDVPASPATENEVKATETDALLLVSSEPEETARPDLHQDEEEAITVEWEMSALQDDISEPLALGGETHVPSSPKASASIEEVETTEKDISLLMPSAPEEASRLDLHQEVFETPHDDVSISAPSASGGEADVPTPVTRESVRGEEAEAIEKDASLLVPSAPTERIRMDLHQKEATTPGQEFWALQDDVSLPPPSALKGETDAPLPAPEARAREAEVKATEKDASLLLPTPEETARLDLHQEEAINKTGPETSVPQDDVLLSGSSSFEVEANLPPPPQQATCAEEEAVISEQDAFASEEASEIKFERAEPAFDARRKGEVSCDSTIDQNDPLEPYKAEALAIEEEPSKEEMCGLEEVFVQALISEPDEMEDHRKADPAVSSETEDLVVSTGFPNPPKKPPTASVTSGSSRKRNVSLVSEVRRKKKIPLVSMILMSLVNGGGQNRPMRTARTIVYVERRLKFIGASILAYAMGTTNSEFEERHRRRRRKVGTLGWMSLYKRIRKRLPFTKRIQHAVREVLGKHIVAHLIPIRKCASDGHEEQQDLLRKVLQQDHASTTLLPVLAFTLFSHFVRGSPKAKVVD